MKKLLGIIYFTLLSSMVTAQPTQQSVRSGIDSLEKLLASSQADTSRVTILSELTLRYIGSSHDTAMKYAQEGLALARALKFRKGEADCLRRSGIILYQQGRYPEALDIFQRALSISENINYPMGIGSGFFHIGNIYNEQGDYPKARSYYFRHLKISESTLGEHEQANALGAIGISYLQQGQLDSASVFLNRALKVVNNREILRLDVIWADMGKLQAKMGNEAEAISFFRKSISTATNINNFTILSDAYAGVANLYRNAGQPDSSIFYARRALTAGQQNNYAKGILAASE
ncbi:tetratricopeptide repeat protein, partial [Persicitalea sp.]|uniref:tetratricopeptide repeat protein n=1 Tax=Persicitalea sp. TaxID=3100273 RepID=UPI0035935265